MKSVKGKFLNKLKTVKAIGYLKPERILDVNVANGFIDNFFAKSSSNKVQEELVQIENKSSVCVSVQEHEIIDVSELMKDLDDDDGSDMSSVVEDKENVGPVNGLIASSLLEDDIFSFRPPDFDSATLFDPNLLAAFKQAVVEVKAQQERRGRVLRSIGDNVDQDREADGEPPLKLVKLEEIDDPLSDFEKVCPPGGSDSVILYTTGLRSIRKTFEDCSSIRFLLQSFRVLYHERDLSMHLDFRDELFRILGGKTVPPRLFIKGRYIGGAEEVLRLHEQGKFRPLLAGIPLNTWDGPCEGCAGVRFVVCFSCSGSRKVNSDDGLLPEKCKECNENGLILCPFCC
ncbi:hypothetical protein QVD17_23319 [Tagetes erecta]|uniref:Glutaredoxin domain-containing protein n=1 Tax=Tagetes erecta TaxID=13708 RepID=A0AAD8NU33_TARER|nr:hypothetical protein QVD17_23319 [Tagetes erecta]